jgi:hypothetical protein
MRWSRPNSNASPLGVIPVELFVCARVAPDLVSGSVVITPCGHGVRHRRGLSFPRCGVSTVIDPSHCAASGWYLRQRCLVMSVSPGAQGRLHLARHFFRRTLRTDMRTPKISRVQISYCCCCLRGAVAISASLSLDPVAFSGRSGRVSSKDAKTCADISAMHADGGRPRRTQRAPY